MAVFKRTFVPIEADIENIKGEVVKLVSNKVMTSDVTDELERFGLDTEGKTGTEIILDQMIFVFGKDKEFYRQFDTGVLFNVVRWVSDSIVKPDTKKK